MAAKRTSGKSGGAKLTRSETVTVRLDPKLNYLCELAGRAQRRTKSSFIEWAIDHALKSVVVPGVDPSKTTIEEVSEQLWDVDEPDRLIALAKVAPVLMTHEEQVVWKVVQQTDWFWERGSRQSKSTGGLKTQYVRDNWDTVKAIAEGSKTATDLPEPSRFATMRSV